MTVLETMERKVPKIGELKVQIMNMKHSMGDSPKALAQNQKRLVQLNKDCTDKVAHRDETQKMRVCDPGHHQDAQ